MFESNLRLEEIEFIAGSTQILEFTIYDRNDDFLDFTGATITWYLSEIGNTDSPLVIKTNENIDTPSDGVVRIKIDPSDTIDLSVGKYEHELTIAQLGGRVAKPCYGFIKIKDCAKQ